LLPQHLAEATYIFLATTSDKSKHGQAKSASKAPEPENEIAFGSVLSRATKQKRGIAIDPNAI